MKLIKILLLAAVLAVLAGGALYVIAPAKFADLAVAAERRIAGLERKQVEVDGLQIVYLDSGGTGEPLLLVHGFGGDKDNWTRLTRDLRSRYRIIAPDLPGYGESSSPMMLGYGIEDQVGRLHAFVKAIGLSRVHIGGCSMGGHIAARYTSLHPNEVGSLWLIANAGVSSAPPSELQESLKGGRNPLIARTPEEFRGIVSFVMSKPPVIPDAVIEVLAERAVASYELRVKQFQDLVGVPSQLEEQIAGLPTPTHILWGDQDRALNVGAVPILQKLLPNSSATVLPGIGHLPMMEVPKQAAQDYLAFRDRVSAAAP
jgi:pimeloyl-ACP methyl ester carboxylesterase